MKIKVFKDPVLFEKARLVRDDEFGKELDDYMSEMAITMFTGTGVGLSGNQVGDPRRLLVADLGYVAGLDYGVNLVKMVNPEIIQFSEETEIADEGCLSYPGLEVMVERPKFIQVRFFSPFGAESILDLHDWQARIISHEMSHLNGETILNLASKFVQRRYEEKLKKIGWLS